MTNTNFALMNPEEIQAWSMESLKAYREKSFWTRFMGDSSDSVVHNVTQIASSPHGIRAFLHLVPDMKAAAVIGDNTLIGNEKGMSVDYDEIRVHMMRQAVRSTGEFSDRQSIIDFTKTAFDQLTNWLADTMDSLFFLTASGVEYDTYTDGSAWVADAGQQNLTGLNFNADVRAPSSARGFMYTNTGALVPTNTAALAGNFLPTYDMLVKLKARAHVEGIKPLNIAGQSAYIFVCHPITYALLKLDDKFHNALKDGKDRGDKNPIFTGADAVMVDGLVIYTSNRVFNTLGATAPNKWGTGGTVDGTRSLLLGKQALAFAMVDKKQQFIRTTEDADNQKIVVIKSFFGMLKPQFASTRNGGTKQDFGIMTVDTALTL